MNNKKTSVFGVHLTIDGYGGDPKKLNDINLIYTCLEELPGLIGMKKLAPPTVYRAPELSPKDSGGYSGFVVITTSHISCHTFPGRRFVSIDAYTCQDEIDRCFVEKYFKQAFSLEELEVNEIKRGVRYPIKDIT